MNQNLIYIFCSPQDEYTLQRHLVVPLIEPESPPPSPPATYITSAELNRIAPQDWTRPSPLQRMGRSVGCDLPQHVAEKFSNKNILSISYICNKCARRERNRFFFFFFFFRLFVGFSTVGRIITHNQQDDSLGGAVDQTDPISVHCTIYLDKKDYELTICYN